MNIVHERKRLPDFNYTHSVIILLRAIPGRSRVNGAAVKLFEEADNENLFVVGVTDFGADWLLL